ncbi:unnamed protein product [Caenorhabditis auriculariae]|uniref:RRM domain-containing protein n=1 Tax=Caenorhabditis auriculariae TaxID=2777116 RepID=A0A8S1GRJ3_9PELO|nr:unnamed protein product [Caenorhabditis auriculariae]
MNRMVTTNPFGLAKMSFKQQMMNMSDRSHRSVFVGNISYDVQDESIRQIFLPRLDQFYRSKMVNDRETGKPKGYGFVEYADVQTAELAIRNLNGFELNGRPLRVDSAAGGERTADEMNTLQTALEPQEEKPVWSGNRSFQSSRGDFPLCGFSAA